MAARTVLSIVALASMLTVIPSVRGADAPSRPTEVAEADWVAFGDSLGFVIEHERTNGRDRSVQGHFMVRRAGGWWRLDAQGGPALLPTTACPTARPRELPSTPKSPARPNLFF